MTGMTGFALQIRRVFPVGKRGSGSANVLEGLCLQGKEASPERRERFFPFLAGFILFRDTESSPHAPPGVF